MSDIQATWPMRSETAHYLMMFAACKACVSVKVINCHRHGMGIKQSPRAHGHTPRHTLRGCAWWWNGVADPHLLAVQERNQRVWGIPTSTYGSEKGIQLRAGWALYTVQGLDGGQTLHKQEQRFVSRRSRRVTVAWHAEGVKRAEKLGSRNLRVRDVVGGNILDWRICCGRPPPPSSLPSRTNLCGSTVHHTGHTECFFMEIHRLFCRSTDPFFSGMDGCRVLSQRRPATLDSWPQAPLFGCMTPTAYPVHLHTAVQAFKRWSKQNTMSKRLIQEEPVKQSCAVPPRCWVGRGRRPLALCHWRQCKCSCWNSALPDLLLFAWAPTKDFLGHLLVAALSCAGRGRQRWFLLQHHNCHSSVGTKDALAGHGPGDGPAAALAARAADSFCRTLLAPTRQEKFPVVDHSAQHARFPNSLTSFGMLAHKPMCLHSLASWCYLRRPCCKHS